MGTVKQLHFPLLGVILTLLCITSESVSTKDSFYFLFKEFVTEYSKPYFNDTEELNHRYNIFKQNLLNLSKTKFYPGEAKFGITKFSDLTKKEFADQYLSDFLSKKPILTSSKSVENYTSIIRKLRSLKVPQVVDWRLSGAVSSVKNQGICGACWAFSCVETMESMYAIELNTTAPEFSVQEVIDCADDSFGCNGGDTCSTLDWLNQSQKTVVYESAYPLKDVNEPCVPVLKDANGVQLTSYKCNNFVGEETVMIEQLANVGPLVTAVDATSWVNYQQGIIQFHCEINNNHAVQIVGYNLTNPVPYYIVRNSWGKNFGIQGYLYIAIGKNLCGLAQEVSALRVKAI